MPNILIESLGIYLPDREVSTKEVIESCENMIHYPLERLTGISSRHVAGENEFSIDLARQAISRCLEYSKYQPTQIDLLICCNISRCSKKYHVAFEPSTAVQLKQYFGFDKATCFDISNACAGMFTAINIVDGFIKSKIARRALVVSGEKITPLCETAQKEITDNRDDLQLASLTLGDSGAAIILEESPNAEVGLHDIEMFTLGNFSDLCVSQPNTKKHGGYIMNTQAEKLHQIGIHKSVKFMVDKLKAFVNKDSIDHFLFHQTSQFAIQKFGEGLNEMLGMNLCNSHNNINNLKHRGNTSSTTHFIALWDKINDGTIKPNDTVFFGVQASGLTLGSALYTFDNLPDRIRQQEKQNRIWIRGTVMNRGPKLPHIAIRSLGTALHIGEEHANSFELAISAIRSCFKEGGCARRDVGLLINSGVYRNNFILEPAIASIIAGEAQLNASPQDLPDVKTLAFDLVNGACGFLQACWNARVMILSGKTEKALCVSSEIENNRKHPTADIMGLKESGCAVLLEKSYVRGFIHFLFKHYPECHEAFRSELQTENGNPFLIFSRQSDLEFLILERIGNVIKELLSEEQLSLNEITVFIPPQISGQFVRTFTAQLTLPEKQVVNLNDDQNYYTCSTVFSLKHAIETGMVRQGDLGVILEAGSGLQIAAALYRF